ncbi:Glucosidase 2 subunit alpha [Ceratocystis lukuohia]|uniref:alpha-glucosidase n=1 Tax=Ceratocystis lukuohia TaxID=2019550 RepID=A0ABR4MS41_9PEZI
MRTSASSPSWATTAIAVVGVLSGLGITPADAVKEHDFKKCDQAGFCKRNREYADKARELGQTWSSPYDIVPESVSFVDGQLQATVLKTISKNAETVSLPLTVSFHETGTARVTLDEERRQKKDIELRHNSKARKERYNEVEQFVIVGGLTLDKKATVAEKDQAKAIIKFGPDSTFEAHISFSPFSIDFKREGATQIQLNDRGLMNMEHWRPKTEEEGEGEDQSTWWDETFGGNTDSKPRGPESVALDITFPGFEHVYGIPSHAGPLSLKETKGGEDKYSEPFRLYNADVFEYILDSPMTLYGSIPFMQAHRRGSTVGVFWLNAAETWVDVAKHTTTNEMALGASARTTTSSHWISESGLMDLFVFLGPTPRDVLKSYGELTGFTALPQSFSLGYHQCRWNYVSDEDVKDVDRRMDKSRIPYDVIWLDIEYTDEKKYFSWNPDTFADPISMGKQLDSHGRKLVTIIDPHIKNVDNYEVVKELKEKEFAVNNKEGKIFEGWCWPGSSFWIDSFSPAARKWWGSLFAYDKFKGTMENTFIWNDMNEPSVFNGPETTMPKDNLHYGGWEHRDVHNLMGMTLHNATQLGMQARKKDEARRPFVLTRSFFAGSQRLGAMWTGDNQADWGHLAASIPMVLSQGISGFPFAGADVGGFFGNPDKDLLARWYQAGIWYPFFRGHAHIDSRRREPYLAGEEYTPIITAALRLRYSLMPAWYTAFYEASKDASPIVRPMYYTNPNDEGSFAIDDQLFLGSYGLLAKPVVEKEQATVDIYIPDEEVYYDYFTYAVVPTKQGNKVSLPATMESIPILMQGGHIIPRRDIPRRSSQLMQFDDYTLVITVSKAGVATGELYVDDGDSYEYTSGQYIHRKFTYSQDTISSVDAEGRNTKSVKPGVWMKNMASVAVDKIVIVGAPETWNKEHVTVTSGGKSWSAKVQYTKAEGSRAAYAQVGRVGAQISADWTITT